MFFPEARVRVYLYGQPVDMDPISATDAQAFVDEHVPKVFRKRWEDEGQVDFAYSSEGIGRFRVNGFHQRGLVSIVFRHIKSRVPSLEELSLQAEPLLKLAQAKDTTGWKLVQRAFEKQGLHRKTSKNLNIWTIKVSGPRKTKELKAYLLQDPKLLFPVQPLDNPSLTVITDAEGGVE